MKPEELPRILERHLLAMGIVFLPAITAAYTIRIRPDSDVITIGTLFVIMLVSVFTLISLAKSLSFRVLLWVGVTGWVLFAVSAFIFIQKVTAPIE